MKQVYYNGKIITLETQDAEAILVEDGKIIKTGTEKEIFETIQQEEVEQINLEGSCLMPAFIDIYSNLTELATALENTSIDTEEQMIKAIKKAEGIYASYGITTVQDSFTTEKEYKILEDMAKNEMLNLDVISYMDMKTSRSIIERNRRIVRKYINNYKIGGYKIYIDDLYKTYQVENFAQNAVDEEMQLMAKCDGEAALEQLIRAYERIGAFENYRPIMLNTTTIKKDQLDRMEKIDMLSNFYKTPLFDKNIFNIMWMILTGQLENGIETNEKQNILDVIKIFTIKAAYQYFEEDYKGTIKEGKNADFVIINKNPLEVILDDIKNIKILYTIKNGQVIYKNKEN